MKWDSFEVPYSWWLCLRLVFIFKLLTNHHKLLTKHFIATITHLIWTHCSICCSHKFYLMEESRSQSTYISTNHSLHKNFLLSSYIHHLIPFLETKFLCTKNQATVSTARQKEIASHISGNQLLIIYVSQMRHLFEMKK